MRPPQSFYDLTLKFHQDLDLVYPDWATDSPHDRLKIYESFRRRYGDEAVKELAAYFRRLIADDGVNLKSLLFEKSKADWVISEDGVRRIFEDFEEWAGSLR